MGFWRFLSALKEQSCVGYAKVASVGGFCDINLLVIKATAPDDLPLPQKYIDELLKVFSISPSSFRAFFLSFTGRFGKTSCWRVALKCLLLLHSLLLSVPETSPFRAELLWSRANGLILLNPCRFLDKSSSSSEHYTTFIRSYAQFLDEALDCVSLDGSAPNPDHEEEQSHSMQHKMKEIGWKLEVLPRLQSLIDKVMECRPRGPAARSFIIQLATKYIIRDSFVSYTTFRKEMASVLDDLLLLPYKNCMAALEIYKKAAVQARLLSEFYDWCGEVGICGPYEHPFVDHIPNVQLQALELFLYEMWQFTESPSSSSPPTLPTSAPESPPSRTRDDRYQIGSRDVVISTKWEIFEDDFPGELERDEKPLMQLEEYHDSEWEALLDSSIDLGRKSGTGFTILMDPVDKSDAWKMQLWGPNAFHPFYQLRATPYYGNVYHQ